MNVAKIKGMHNAMKSGMLAAEAVFESVSDASPSAQGKCISYSNFSLHSLPSLVHACYCPPDEDYTN